MKKHTHNPTAWRYLGKVFPGAMSVPLLIGGVITDAGATAPCEDFGVCKAIIEINSTDGDVGFHWLVDGDDLNSARIDNPNGRKVFENKAFGPLRDQKLTETFGESAERAAGSGSRRTRTMLSSQWRTSRHAGRA